MFSPMNYLVLFLLIIIISSDDSTTTQAFVLPSSSSSSSSSPSFSTSNFFVKWKRHQQQQQQQQHQQYSFTTTTNTFTKKETKSFASTVFVLHAIKEPTFTTTPPTTPTTHDESQSSLSMSPSSLSSSSSSSQSLKEEISRNSSNIISKVQISKPLGIVLEEIEEGDEILYTTPPKNKKNGGVEVEAGCGVQIVQMNTNGNAAKMNRIAMKQQLQQLQQNKENHSTITGNNDNDDDSIPSFLCIHDKVLQINGEDVSTCSLDQVMEKIINSPDDTVELCLERPKDGIMVQFTTTNNGVCVAAQPGEYLGNVANQAGITTIPYSCRSGSCGTCEQSVIAVVVKEKKEEETEEAMKTASSSSSCSTKMKQIQKYCRPCSYRLPKQHNIHSMFVSPSDRFVR